MAAPIFLYPSLTDEIRDIIFQAKKYNFSYTDHDSQERDLEYETSEISSSVNCLKTDGIWSAEKYGLHVRRSIALRKYRNQGRHLRRLQGAQRPLPRSVHQR